MKSFCIITYGCLVYLMCMISLNGIAQLIHKVPQEFNLKATSFSEHFAKKKVCQKHTNYTSLKKEQHFDIYYPSYDSLDYELTQGVFLENSSRF